tara:strand:+ start:162 stop:815 length:654 start_codon:yes stop_codon:yes gene_type:complete
MSTNKTKNSDDNNKKGNKVIEVTIYLPNRDNIEILMHEKSTVQSVIKEALKYHQEHQITPVLHYNDPDIYDLRTHDEDGFPGDFALDRNKFIKEFTEYERILRKDRSGYDDVALNEFCLVESEIGKRKVKAAAAAAAAAAAVSNKSPSSTRYSLIIIIIIIITITTVYEYICMNMYIFVCICSCPLILPCYMYICMYVRAYMTHLNYYHYCYYNHYN